MSDKDISTLLQITSSTIHQFQEQQRERGDDFNIFKILDKERREVDTHSLFLYELLNPKGSHHQGDIFVKLFLREVLDIDNYGEVIEVKREDPTNENRRIDFTINTDQYLIGIEMKIDARDQHAQLYDYHKELVLRNKKNKKEVKIFYLTLTGYDPSVESLNGLKTVENISFKKHINHWLSSCIETAALKPVIRELINQYLILIKKLTNQHKELDMKVIEEIGKNKDNLLAAEQIADNYSQAAAKIEANVWIQIVSCLNNLNKKPDWSPSDFESDIEACRNTDGEGGFFMIYYKLGKLIGDKDDEYLWIDLSNHNSHNYLRFSVYLGDSDGNKCVLSDTKKLEPRLKIIAETLESKLTFAEEKYKWGDFVSGNIDSTFKLRGNAENLIEWMGVNDKSEKITNTAQKIDQALVDIKAAAAEYLEEEKECEPA